MNPSFCLESLCSVSRSAASLRPTVQDCEGPGLPHSGTRSIVAIIIVSIVIILSPRPRPSPHTQLGWYCHFPEGSIYSRHLLGKSLPALSTSGQLHLSAPPPELASESRQEGQDQLVHSFPTFLKQQNLFKYLSPSPSCVVVGEGILPSPCRCGLRGTLRFLGTQFENNHWTRSPHPQKSRRQNPTLLADADHLYS